MTVPRPERPDTGRPDIEVPPTRVDPTLRVERPPVPGRAVRAEMAAGGVARPPIRPDDPTVALAHGHRDPRRTLAFGTPAPVTVTVGPRRRPRRRYRTWPWVVAVVLALAVLGVTLLVMMSQGETVDGDTDLIGSGPVPIVSLRGS